MERKQAPRGRQLGVRAIGLLLPASLLALLLLSPAGAQEQETVVRVEVDSVVQPVKEGDQFAAQVLVENVEHLCCFEFILKYDPDKVRPVEGTSTAPEGTAAAPSEQPLPADTVAVKVLDMGQIFSTSGGRQDLLCARAVADTKANTVDVSCSTVGLPVCLGGAEGPSGAGVLGRVLFTSRGDGTAKLELTKTTLLLDDVRPCDPENLNIPEIPHRREDASVEVIGGGGGISWAVLAPIIIAAVAVVLVGSYVGYQRYQRRRPTPST